VTPRLGCLTHMSGTIDNLGSVHIAYHFGSGDRTLATGCPDSSISTARHRPAGRSPRSGRSASSTTGRSRLYPTTGLRVVPSPRPAA
jgi:hypothetical protein